MLPSHADQRQDQTLRDSSAERIPYTRPSITEREIRHATDAVTNGWGARCYDYIHRFEREFGEHLDVGYALATSSCTGAMHLGLAAMGIGPGDEVILADTNWIATVAPIVHLGAQPVFVDILPDTWCINPALIEPAITPRTRAVIATHLYGNLCDMDQIRAVCDRHGIPVIEDAAEAIGSTYRGRRAGSMGLFGTFSFHGTKTITTGEGGMLVTSDNNLYERVLTLSNHGRARTQARQFWPEVVGYKFKMSNVQAAIGCAQLERVEELVRRKRDILQYYADAFASIEEISMNLERAETQIGAWMPTIAFLNAQHTTGDMILAALRDDLTDARPVFAPLSDFSMFPAQPENRVARQFAERAVNLPSFHDATEAQLERVVNVVRAVYVG